MSDAASADRILVDFDPEAAAEALLGEPDLGISSAPPPVPPPPASWSTTSSSTFSLVPPVSSPVVAATEASIFSTGPITTAILPLQLNSASNAARFEELPGSSLSSTAVKHQHLETKFSGNSGVNCIIVDEAPLIELIPSIEGPVNENGNHIQNGSEEEAQNESWETEGEVVNESADLPLPNKRKRGRPIRNNEAAAPLRVRISKVSASSAAAAAAATSASRKRKPTKVFRYSRANRRQRIWSESSDSSWSEEADWVPSVSTRKSSRISKKRRVTNSEDEEDEGTVVEEEQEIDVDSLSLSENEEEDDLELKFFKSENGKISLDKSLSKVKKHQLRAPRLSKPGRPFKHLIAPPPDAEFQRIYRYVLAENEVWHDTEAEYDLAYVEALHPRAKEVLPKIRKKALSRLRYTEDQRDLIVKLVRAYGPRKASLKLNLPCSTVQAIYRRSLENVEKRPGRRPIFTQIENYAIAEALRLRDQNLPATHFHLQNVAASFAAANQISDFKASLCWVQKILKRNRVVLEEHGKSQLGSLLPGDLEVKIGEFQTAVDYEKAMNQFPDDFIMNLDEFSMYFEPSQNEILIGQATNKRANLLNFSIILTVTASGHLLRIFVVFRQQKTQIQVNSNANVLAVESPDYDSLMDQYLREIIRPFLNAKLIEHGLDDPRQPAMLVLDSLPLHTSQEVWVGIWEQHCHAMVVPPGCNPKCQPLNVLVTRMFREAIRAQYGAFLRRSLAARSLDPQQAPQNLAATPAMIVEWVSMLRRFFNSKCGDLIRRSFEVCGLIGDNEGNRRNDALIRWVWEQKLRPQFIAEFPDGAWDDIY